MLRNHQPIQLTEGQQITVVAVGDDYTSWEGYKDESSRETKIGLSYAKLCQDVKVGGRILLADGSVGIKVCLADQQLPSFHPPQLRCTNKQQVASNCGLTGTASQHSCDVPCNGA